MTEELYKFIGKKMNKIQNDRLLKACRGKEVDHPPVWMMRQAGRCLPQYRELREDHSFLEIINTPELAAKVTLMPVEEFGVDAAIIFSDILAIPEEMGMDLSFESGTGPVFHSPFRNENDLNQLQQFRPRTSLQEQLEAIRETKNRLEQRVPLIGFTGAPWTLASYMIEGQSTRKFRRAKALLYEKTDLVSRLMDLLREQIVRVLEAQIEAGADVVQLFDTTSRVLSAGTYRNRVLPRTKKIFEELAEYSVPKIYFSRGTSHSLQEQNQLMADVLSIDWTTDFEEARGQLNGDVVLQGNLDPAVLLTNRDVVRKRTNEMLARAAPLDGYIANLGHGILPDTPLENSTAFVETVQTYGKNRK